jgi:phage-related protein
VPEERKRARRKWRDYRTAAGGRPVKTFLDGLTDEEVAAIVAGMKDVAVQGLSAARHLRGDIYEVRADASARSFRLLFSTEGRWSQVLLSLSVFEKRTQKAPQREIELAERRLADWRRRGAAMRKAKKRKT